MNAALGRNLQNNEVSATLTMLHNLTPRDRLECFDVPSGKSLLHYAVEIPSPLLLKSILAKYEVNVKSVLIDGTQPIHLACRLGRLEHLKALVHHNADLADTDGEGRSCAMIAQLAGYDEILEWILENGGSHEEVGERDTMRVSKSHLLTERPSHTISKDLWEEVDSLMRFKTMLHYKPVPWKTFAGRRSRQRGRRGSFSHPIEVGYVPFRPKFVAGMLMVRHCAFDDGIVPSSVQESDCEEDYIFDGYYFRENRLYQCNFRSWNNLVCVEYVGDGDNDLTVEVYYDASKENSRAIVRVFQTSFKEEEDEEVPSSVLNNTSTIASSEYATLGFARIPGPEEAKKLEERSPECYAAVVRQPMRTLERSVALVKHCISFHSQKRRWGRVCGELKNRIRRIERFFCALLMQKRFALSITAIVWKDFEGYCREELAEISETNSMFSALRGTLSTTHGHKRVVLLRAMELRKARCISDLRHKLSEPHKFDYFVGLDRAVEVAMTYVDFLEMASKTKELPSSLSECRRKSIAFGMQPVQLPSGLNVERTKRQFMHNLHELLGNYRKRRSWAAESSIRTRDARRRRSVAPEGMGFSLRTNPLLGRRPSGALAPPRTSPAGSMGNSRLTFNLSTSHRSDSAQLSVSTQHCRDKPLLACTPHSPIPYLLCSSQELKKAALSLQPVPPS